MSEKNAIEQRAERGASVTGKGVFAYAPTTAIRVLTRFLALVIYTRLLSPEAYGLYMLVLANVALVQTLLFLWIEAAAFRFFVRAEAAGWLPDLLTSLKQLSSVMIGVCILCGGVLAFVFFVSGQVDFSLGVITTIALACLGFLTNLRREVLRAQSRSGRYTLLDAASKIGGLCLGVCFVFALDWGGLGPILGAITALGMILIVDALTWKAHPIEGKSRRSIKKMAMRYGAGIALAQGAAIILSMGDRYILAVTMGTEAVGIYAAGYGLAAQLIGFLFTGAGLAAAPLTLRAYENSSEAQSVAIARRFLEILMLIAMPAGIGISLVAQPLAHIVIGPELANGAVMVIQWIAPASIMAGLLTSYCELPFMLKRRTETLAIVTGVAGAVNIGLNLLLIPIFGILGAIWATIISYLGAIIGALILGRRYFALPLPIAYLSRLIGACLIMALTVKFLDMHVFAAQTAPHLLHLGALSLAGLASFALASMALGMRPLQTLRG